jgi:hypothetical protein
MCSSGSMSDTCHPNVEPSARHGNALDYGSGQCLTASSPPLAESYVNTASAFFNWFVRSRNDSDNKGSFARVQQVRTVRASSKSAYLRVTSAQQLREVDPAAKGAAAMNAYGRLPERRQAAARRPLLTTARATRQTARPT